jgi:sugar lactone lactonase YvrE
MARFEDEFPDGICADAEGAVWVASPPTMEALRVLPDGSIDERISTAPLWAFACALGGDDGHTLFVCTAPGTDPATNVAHRGGQIQARRVAVGAG